MRHIKKEWSDNMNDKAEIMSFLMEQFLNRCCSDLEEQQIRSIAELNEKDIKSIVK